MITMVYKAAALPTNQLTGLAGAAGEAHATTQNFHRMVTAETLRPTGATLAEGILERIANDCLAVLPWVETTSSIGTSAASLAAG